MAFGNGEEDLEKKVYLIYSYVWKASILILRKEIIKRETIIG